MPDYYEILGVSKDANDNELKKSYRQLSMKHHPDRGGDTAKFQEINMAYETLSDPGKKAEYDMEQNGGGGGGHPFGGMHHHGGMPGGMQEMAEMNHIFNMMFNGGRGMPGGMPGGMPPGMMHSFGGGGGIRVFHNGVQVNVGGDEGGNLFHQLNKPPPIIKNINISIEQAFIGVSVPIEIEKWVIIQNMKVFEKETISLSIPKGIDNNEIIIVRDRGNVINEQIKGDLKLIINVENNTEFVRNGLDVIYKKNLSLKEALCGFSFNVKHLNGSQLCMNNTSKRNIIKPNFKKIVPNMGFSKDGFPTGNLIIDFEIEFPDSLTEEQMDSIAGIL